MTVVALVGTLWLGWSSSTLDACAVVPSDDVRAMGGDGIARPFVPEGPHRRATGCSYGRDPDVGVTVFALPHGGREMVALHEQVMRERGIAQRYVRGPTYRGYLTTGPRPDSESLVLVRGERYVNVIVYNGPPGAAERLVPIAGRAL